MGRTGYRGLRLLKTGTRRGSLTWAGTRASERGAPVAQGRWSRSSGSGPRSPTSAAKPEPEGTRVNNTSMLLKHSSVLALTLICKRPVVMVTQTHMPSQLIHLSGIPGNQTNQTSAALAEHAILL